MKHILILFLFLIVSCNHKHIETMQSIRLFENKEFNLTPNDIYTDYELIPLETNKECMLGDITKIEVHNGIYYILDRPNQQCVLAFNNEGKYINRIGKIGNSPEEYPQISDFTIDKINERIIILSPPSIVYLYDLSGKFIMSKDLKISSFENISAYGSNIICYTKHLTDTEGEGAFLIFKFDEKLNLINKYIPVHQKQLYSSNIMQNPVQELGNKAYVFDVFTHNIYSLGDDIKAYPVQFKNPMPINNFADMTLFLQNMRNYDYILDATIVDSILAINYIHNGNLYYAATDFQNGIQHNGEYIGLKLPFMNVVGDTIISYIDVIQYDEYWKDITNYDINDSICFDDNFLIMRCRLK